MRKLVAIFLILVLSVQVIPVQEVGRLLSGQTMTEEIPVHEVAVKVSPVLEIFHSHQTHFSNSISTSELSYFDHNEDLITFPYLEVPVQPPNS